MSLEDYKKALKQGKKDYQSKISAGQKPTLEVLDEILGSSDTYSVIPVGRVQIPMDQIAGTRYAARSTSFAANFMPIMDANTEFSAKWAQLETTLEEEGIRDPIKAYEYMHRFYVEEGNKRVSVMRYLDAVSIPAEVTRIVPKRSGEKEIVLYYEFLEFYQNARIYELELSRKGDYAKLQKLVGKDAGQQWTDEDRIEFLSVYNRFEEVYRSEFGRKLKDVTPGDALLSLMELYGYDVLKTAEISFIREIVSKTKEEYKLLQEEKEVHLQMDPEAEKKKLLTRLLPTGTHGRLRVGFIHEKTKDTSAWTYAHELGRLHVESVFEGDVTTCVYDEADEATVEGKMEQAVSDGCDLIITTTPAFAAATVRAAITHPQIKFLNCSLNTSHRYIRTYYARSHEAKFLMGVIAGAMASNDRILYYEDYPLYGTIANINAFALGAKMVNPRAKVYLEWTAKRKKSTEEQIFEINPDCISTKDIIIPDGTSRYYGLYYRENGEIRSLAMPICNWGRFYEKLIRKVMDGTWKDDDTSHQALNYWWGMNADIVDVICSSNLPIGIQRLVEVLKQDMIAGSFRPFTGPLYAREGIVESTLDHDMTPEEIMQMDWLAENVIGSIPELSELTEQAAPVVKQQGVRK